MKVKDLVNRISDEKIVIVHAWEYYKNHFTDEQHIYFVDEIPDHILSMNVCTISGYLYDIIQIRLFPSRSLYFRTDHCSCYESVMRWIDEHIDIVKEWQKEVSDK